MAKGPINLTLLALGPASLAFVVMILSWEFSKDSDEILLILVYGAMVALCLDVNGKGFWESIDVDL